MTNETIIVAAGLYSLLMFFVGVVVGDFHANEKKRKLVKCKF